MCFTLIYYVHNHVLQVSGFKGSHQADIQLSYTTGWSDQNISDVEEFQNHQLIEVLYYYDSIGEQMIYQ